MVFPGEQMLMWPDFPETCNTNFNEVTLSRIKDNPRAWINTLPMFEYAMLLVSATAQRLGGAMEPYIDNLYKIRMNPILKQYYDKLMTYRFHRMILMRKYNSMQNHPDVKGNSVTLELAKMRAYADKTRRALRGVCADFEQDKFNGVAGPTKATADTLQECYPE